MGLNINELPLKVISCTDTQYTTKCERKNLNFLITRLFPNKVWTKFVSTPVIWLVITIKINLANKKIQWDSPKKQSLWMDFE